MVMTTVEMRLLVRRSSDVSHLGRRESVRPELKVVISLAIVSRECVVEIPCTRSCAVGSSKRTEVVPGMRCKNCDTRLLSEDALTVSMVMRVMSLLGRQTTR